MASETDNPQELKAQMEAPATFGGLLPELDTPTDDQQQQPEEEGLISLEDDAELEMSSGDDVAPMSVVTEADPRPGMTGKTAEARAAKTHFGLGDDSPGMPAILQHLAVGTEDSLRRRVADQEAIRQGKLRIDMIREKAAQGGTISPEDVQFMSGMLNFDPATLSPETILERKYANNVINSLSYLNDGEVISAAYVKNPQALADRMGVAEELLTRQEIIKNAIEDVEAIYKDQSWGGWLVDQAKSLFPLYTAAKLKLNAPEGTTDSLLAGNVTEDMVNSFWSMPVDEMAPKLREFLMGVARDNPSMARDLAHKMLSMTSGDAFIDNAFTVLDAATFPGIPTALKVGAKGARMGAEAVQGLRATQGAERAAEAASDAARAVSNAAEGTASRTAVTVNGQTAVDETLKATVKANAHPEADAARQLNEMGDVERSVNVSLLKRANEIIDNADIAGDFRVVKDRIGTFMSPESILEKEAPNLGFMRANRIVERLRLSRDELAEAAFKNTVTVARTPEEAFMAGVREAAERIQQDWAHVNDSLLNVKWNLPEDDKIANVGRVSVLYGTRDLKQFTTREAAEKAALKDYGFPEGSYRIEQQGSGYHISVTKTVDETGKAVRDNLLTGANTTPVNNWSTFLGLLRSGDNRVAPFQNQNRKTAVHARSVLEGALKDAVNRIGFMSKKSTDELNEVMTKNKYEPDPMWDGKGEMRRGRFYHTVQEFETSFYETHKKFPSEKQTQAYFQFVQFNEFEYFLRNAGWYRDRARMGIEEIAIRDLLQHTDGAIEEVSESFHGKVVKDLPYGSVDDARIAIHKAGSEPQFFRMNSMTDEQKALIQTLQKEGHQIVQVENPTRVPYEAKFGKDTVNFIVTKDIEVRPLSGQQVPYREGWHTQYAYDWYIKVPKLQKTGGEATENGVSPVRHRYTGDVAFAGVKTEVEAVKWSKQLEEARQLLVEANQSGDFGKLSAFLKASDLPFDEKAFRGFYEPKVKPDGSMGDPVLDINAPFLHVFNGNTTTDKYGELLRSKFEGFEDTVRSSHNLFYNVDKKFYGMRDNPLQTFHELGEESRPVWAVADGAEIDPLTSVQKAMANVLRSRQMTDYKISHTEAWVKQFGHLLDVEPEKLAADPVFYIHQGTFRRSDPSNYQEMRAAKDSRRALIELLGSESELSIMNKWLQHKLMNSIYADAEPGSARQTAVDKIIEAGTRKDGKDPVSLMRATAFHTNIGLFNPYQLLQNMATMGNAIAIAPRHGFQGAAAALPMRWAFHNPALVDKMANIVTSFGWTKEMFKESLEELRKSGRFIIEGEHTWKDNIADPSVRRSVWGSVLDGGLVFFREGERATRLVAWNTAFREWRTANPHMPITDAVRRQILDRSDDMTANMTRASNATWQQGIAAVPAQFMSYHVRLTEQTLGKKLTSAEKARLIALNSIMYGIPIGTLGSSAGGALFGGQYPLHEGVREQMLKDGKPVADNWSILFNEGLTGLLSKIVTGEPTNLNEKIGPAGGQLFKNLFTEDKAFLNILFGASGSKTGSVWESLDPITRWIMSPLKDDDEKHALTGQDLLAVARNIKSVDNALNVYYAWNYQAMYNKKGQYMGDQTTMQAVFKLLTGADMRKVTDKQLMQGLSIDRDKMVREISAKIGNEYNALIEAARTGDFDAAEMYRKRINGLATGAGLTVQERSTAFQEAIKKNQNKLDQVQWDFLFKKGSPDELKKRQENFFNKGYAGQK